MAATTTIPGLPFGLPLGRSAPWLAPLAGYSDLPFRMLCRSYGAACCVTEMVSVKGLTMSRNPATERLLETLPGPAPAGDNPLVVQLFGCEPERFRASTAMLAEWGYTAFDLNAGCPVKKVLKSGGGAKLLDDPDLLVSIARAMVEAAGSLPVGVKTRLGFETGKDVFLDLGKRLEDAGVSWMTLHPRYGRQMFTGTAYWTAWPSSRRCSPSRSSPRAICTRPRMAWPVWSSPGWTGSCTPGEH